MLNLNRKGKTQVYSGIHFKAIELRVRQENFLVKDFFQCRPLESNEYQIIWLKVNNKWDTRG